ncbi:MAG: hypothetical protein J6Z11_07700, partial [Candidatus Riflebacteria bacterium]|nr:hypothetical protein [Candidatus Riflebacteria bacterium]
MKYKILALSVASVIGISSIVLASDNTGIAHYLYSGKEFTHRESTDKTSISDISFTKGDMIAFNWNDGKKESDYEEESEDDEELGEEEYDDDESIDESSSSDDEADNDYDYDSPSSSPSTSKGGGFADIKALIDKKNQSLPVSKTDYHIHKNAPARTFTNKLDPQGAMTEYITYFYGDEIEMKHTVSFLANGSVNINGSCKANFTANTPSKSWSNSKKVNGQTIMEFYYFNGKIKASFTLTPLRNGTTNVTYNTLVVDPNI